MRNASSKSLPKPHKSNMEWQHLWVPDLRWREGLSFSKLFCYIDASVLGVKKPIAQNKQAKNHVGNEA